MAIGAAADRVPPMGGGRGRCGYRWFYASRNKRYTLKTCRVTRITDRVCTSSDHYRIRDMTRKRTVMEFLKVSSKSSPSSVAGAIAGMIKDGVPVDIQSVGAGAVNQAVKAIAISRGFLSPVGIEIVCVPSFADILIDG